MSSKRGLAASHSGPSEADRERHDRGDDTEHERSIRTGRPPSPNPSWSVVSRRNRSISQINAAPRPAEATSAASTTGNGWSSHSLTSYR